MKDSEDVFESVGVASAVSEIGCAVSEEETVRDDVSDRVIEEDSVSL